MSELDQEMKIKVMEKELEVLKELEELLGDDFMVTVSERLEGTSIEEILQTNPERMVDEPTSEIIKKILSRRYHEYLETEPKEETKEEPKEEQSNEQKVYTEEEIERIAQERVEQRLREEEKKRMLQQQLDEEKRREEEERKRVEEEIRRKHQRSLDNIENYGKKTTVKKSDKSPEEKKRNMLIGLGIGAIGAILLGLFIVFALPQILPYVKESNDEVLYRNGEESKWKVQKELPEYLEEVYIPVLEKHLDTELTIKEETIDLSVDKFTYDNLGEDKREVLLPLKKSVLKDYIETPYSVKTDISGLHNLETSQALSSTSAFPVTSPTASSITSKVAVYEIGVLQPTPESSREVLAGLEPGHFEKFRVNDAVIPIYVEKPKKENLVSYVETGATKEEVNSKNKLNPIKRIQIVSDKGIVTEFLYSSYKGDEAFRWVRY